MLVKDNKLFINKGGVFYILLVCYFLVNKVHGNNKIGTTDVVRNLTVKVIEEHYFKDSNVKNILKLNVSWVPSNKGVTPSSYSILVTGLSDNRTYFKCPEKSIYYTTKNNQEREVILPKRISSSDIPEIVFLHNCSYRVVVYANPRTQRSEKTELIYTIPNCVGDKCNCTGTNVELPKPKVDVLLEPNRSVIIKWKTFTSARAVRGFIISIGIPVLISTAGLRVYNNTRIGNATATCTAFSWDSYVDGKLIKLKSDDKIIVTAFDEYNCYGPEGFYIIQSQDTKFVEQNATIWYASGGIVSIIIVIGAIKILSQRKKTDHILWTNELNSNTSKLNPIPKCKFQWAEVILKNKNVLYVEQEVEGLLYKNYNDSLEIPNKCVKLIRELGEGQFGKVYLGHLEDNDGTNVAVKMANNSNPAKEFEARLQLMEEIEMMKAAGPHPHLVRMIGYCSFPKKPMCIILEYLQGGDLLAYLYSRRDAENKYAKQPEVNGYIHQPRISETLYTTICSQRSFNSVSTSSNNEDKNFLGKYINIQKNITNTKFENNWYGKIDYYQFLQFALDIARGMAHLELKGITHRDLAARNILITADLTLKISDFGLSRNGIYIMSNIPGSMKPLPIRWMSPEAIRDREFSSKSDVWSFGVVLWEIATLGTFPYPNISDQQLLHYVLHNQGRLEKPISISNEVYDLMLQCWSSQPHRRPNFENLILSLKLLEETLHTPQCNTNPCYVLLSSNVDKIT
ncbi:vascular endothelial growth factor receptor 1-like [Prorops nasuta]|uniref:vascular endothelial growth factor receptor 1-like n=1 Tax=Prorops nasuta TaxID=863751 RepID=UPI0034CE939E